MILKNTDDFNDEGQSFFDDNELKDWQSDSAGYNVQMKVPKTEMREPLPEQVNYDENVLLSRNASDGTQLYRPRTHSKRKKGFLNMSSSTKLILFCIASALAIVLLAVAIIAVLKHEGYKNGIENGNDKTHIINV